MRTLYLLRGIPGSGKSTWIKENHLEPYTLSADAMRLMIQSPILTVDGKTVISQNNDKQAWKLLFSFLEERMDRGEFVIVDATHYKKDSIYKYKTLIEKYRYRAYVIDFTDIPLDVCKERNLQREGYKYVPEIVLEKMYNVIVEEAKTPFNNHFKIKSREDAIKDLILTPLDFNEYKNIWIFGDIHGSYTPLVNFFEKHPYSETDYYIFVGDYLDRNIQNKEVLEFFIDFCKHKNVLCLEGNHEKWLRLYISKDENAINRIKSKEFKENTISQIESIDKPSIREFCRKLGQFAYFTYGDITYLVTHGGLPCLPDLKTSTQDMIKGVGKYDEVDSVHDSFRDFSDDYYEKTNIDLRQIHGHRNIFHDKWTYDDTNYNLNASVEFGDDLRVCHICNDEYGVNPKLETIKVDIFVEKPTQTDTIYQSTNNEIIDSLNKDTHIIKKFLKDDIISYAFDRDVFFSGDWNDIRCHARGLFCRGDKIVCRSYEKFFNYQEVAETELDSLREKLVFPVTVYWKENGFLGLISYDKEKNKPFIASKSTNEKEYAGYLKDIFYKHPKHREIINWLKDNDVTMIFEVIDIEHDPHIVEYHSNKIILLDCVYNQFETKYFSYNELKLLSEKFDLECKLVYKEIADFPDLIECIYSMESSTLENKEGFVFRDINNFQFKFKLPWYKKWKYFRGLKDKFVRGNLKQTFTNIEDINFINFLKENYANNLEELNNKSIIDIRKEIENNS